MSAVQADLTESPGSYPHDAVCKKGVASLTRKEEGTVKRASLLTGEQQGKGKKDGSKTLLVSRRPG